LFEQICTKTDCDIISLDLGSKLQFFLTKPPIKQALLRGAVFEISYGQCLLENHLKQRKTFIHNSLNLVRLTKGK
jgi:ribonuclease P/MRP protein subunit RPP1